MLLSHLLFAFICSPSTAAFVINRNNHCQTAKILQKISLLRGGQRRLWQSPDKSTTAISRRIDMQMHLCLKGTGCCEKVLDAGGRTVCEGEGHQILTGRELWVHLTLTQLSTNLPAITIAWTKKRIDFRHFSVLLFHFVLSFLTFLCKHKEQPIGQCFGGKNVQALLCY